MFCCLLKKICVQKKEIISDLKNENSSVRNDNTWGVEGEGEFFNKYYFD